MPRNRTPKKTSPNKVSTLSTPQDGIYKAYIKSPAWFAFRKAIVELRGYKCQLCQSIKDIDLHHMTYKRLGKEDLRDVLLVCRTCHTFIHTEH